MEMISNLVYTAFRRPMGIATVVSVFGAIGANYWFNIFPPKGVKIADLANSIYADTLFIPASYAFAIWGLIYCGLIAFSIYQLGLSERRYGFVLEARPWLILACILQSAWVCTFLMGSLLTSTVIMFGLLGAILRCYQLAEVGHRTLPWRDRLFLQHPWSIYLAWISVATIVNVSITLHEYGWNGLGLPQPLWTIVMMGIATLLAVTILQRRHDWLYAVVVAWALLALVLRYGGIVSISISGLLLLIGLIGILFIWYSQGYLRRSI
jgi:hypothetical protein